MYSPVLQFFTFKPSPSGRVLRGGSLSLMLTLALFAASPSARAVTPAPDGGYPNQNTAEGTNALFSLTTGKENTAIGFDTLFSNNSGHLNTATGAYALFSNKASGNTAIGARALQSNTSGGYNTASGDEALINNRLGGYNVANGVGALHENTNGRENTATGTIAMYSNESGSFNTATGDQALSTNTTGQYNMASGYQALSGNTTGVNNIALGAGAGANLTTGSNNIDMGNGGVAGESNKIRIGTKGTHDGTFIAGISGVTVTGTQVVINSNGRLGVSASSARFKEAIKPMDKASEAILALKPVTFRYRQELDPYGVPQFGLIAEQVDKVNPDLVVRGEDGKVTTVRYEAVNAMLLNEFLKEHGQVQQLKATVAEQQEEIAAQHATAAQQQKQIETLTATVRKVSERIELSGSAPQIAANED